MCDLSPTIHRGESICVAGYCQVHWCLIKIQFGGQLINDYRYLKLQYMSKLAKPYWLALGHQKPLQETSVSFDNIKALNIKTSASLSASYTHIQSCQFWSYKRLFSTSTVNYDQLHDFFFLLWRVVLVGGLWVHEDHSAAWADGEHWSACWQVAYSLLSELALSHKHWDTLKNTHLCTHTLQQLRALIGTQKGLLKRERQRDWYERGNEHQKHRPAGQLFTSKAL